MLLSEIQKYRVSTRQLYTIDDVHLGVAYECSKAGLAAKPIGKLIEAVKVLKRARFRQNALHLPRT
jgi:hypothetical protein